MTHGHARHRQRQRRASNNPVLRWHRRAGLTLAAFFLVVCATGFLLNHAEGLQLNRVTLQADWLYRWYGMQPKSEPVAFAWAENRAVWLEGTLYLDARPLTRTDGLVGAAAVGPLLVAAAPHELVVATPDGEVVERLRQTSLPPGAVTRVGVTRGSAPRLVVQTDDGRQHAFDEGIVSFAGIGETTDAGIAWSEPTAIPRDLRRAVLAAYRGEGLTLQRIVLDVHSGRFFGRAGVYVVDVIGLGLVFLTLTGVYFAFWGRRN